VSISQSGNSMKLVTVVIVSRWVDKDEARMQRTYDVCSARMTYAALRFCVMLTYAHVCSRMLTYAHASGSTRTYAALAFFVVGFSGVLMLPTGFYVLVNLVLS
jgi:hypothetical protein